MKQLFEAVLAHYLHSQGPVLAAARLEPRVRLVEFRRMARKKPRPRLPDRLSDIFIADWGPVCEGYLGIQGRRATTEAGAAILLSRKRHGRLPDNLTDIVRPFVDPFTNRPVKCRREGRNGFVVYSVGVSGKFDGGKPGDKPSSKEHPFRFP